jgi:hypothetical protein
MSGGVGNTKRWSERLPSLLNVLWFVIVLGPPLFVVPVWADAQLHPPDGGHFHEFIVRFFGWELYLSCCLALVWLVLFLLSVGAHRGRLRWWLWLQATCLIGGCLVLYHLFSTSTGE